MSEESTSTRNHVTLAVTNIAVPLEYAFSTVRLQVTGSKYVNPNLEGRMTLLIIAVLHSVGVRGL